jgi:carboxyl-terminal processing protease
MQKTRGKVLILGLSLPLVLYAILGGFLGRALARDSAYRYLAVFQDVLTLVMSNYVEPVKLDVVMEGALRGMMDALDPDSCYLNPTEFTEFQKPSSGKPRAELGIEVTKRYYLQVVSVLPGSPAEAAGLEPGDLLKSVDRLNTRDTNVVVGEALLRGEEGSKVQLQVLRGRSADPIEMTVERKVLSASPVVYKMMDGPTGYVRIASFRPGVAKDVAEAVRTLTAAGASELVLDARDSFGRLAEEAASVAELFVAGGLAATLQARDESRSELRLASDRVLFRGPVVLLVNESSSGAAEILASALQGAKRAELVGAKTAGRAAIQRVVALDDGAGLVLSVSRYWTAEGKALLGNGIEPTVPVELRDDREGAAGDPVLEKGLEVLKSARAKAAA